jgi:hypothetical protein
MKTMGFGKLFYGTEGKGDSTIYIWTFANQLTHKNILTTSLQMKDGIPWWYN